MLDLYSILDPVPLKWRYTTATAVPLLVGVALYPLVGFWSLAGGSLIAVAMVWMLARRQTRYFLRTAVGILRTRAIDRRHRLPIEGPQEQQRISHAVNRLADNVEQTLSESRRNRRYHETILSGLTVGILVVDADGMLQYANPAARKMLGFELDEAEYRLTPLASKVGIFEINEAVTISATTGETVRRIVEIFDQLRHFEVVARGLPPEDSGLGRSVAIITERTEEIRQGVAMRDFVANASHELRTPIASIQASVETLKSRTQLPPETTDQFLDRIDDGAHRMAALVTELMDLTLLETGRTVLRREKSSPIGLVNAVIDNHGSVDAEPPHRIDVEIEDGISSISVDSRKIERALGNIFANAQKFTPAGGHISISCRSDGGHVFFEVSDTGEGIDQEELPHIFERFYKSPRSSGDRTGFGLGLAITKNIVELHGGSVEAVSSLGDGTTISVRLPVSRDGAQ